MEFSLPLDLHTQGYALPDGTPMPIEPGALRPYVGQVVRVFLASTTLIGSATITQDGAGYVVTGFVHQDAAPTVCQPAGTVTGLIKQTRITRLDLAGVSVA